VAKAALGRLEADKILVLLFPELLRKDEQVRKPAQKEESLIDEKNDYQMENQEPEEVEQQLFIDEQLGMETDYQPMIDKNPDSKVLREETRQTNKGSTVLEGPEAEQFQAYKKIVKETDGYLFTSGLRARILEVLRSSRIVLDILCEGMLACDTWKEEDERKDPITECIILVMRRIMPRRCAFTILVDLEAASKLRELFGVQNMKPMSQRV